MKKALIEKFMLGLVLISSLFLFVGTMADDLKTHNEIQKLRKIVQTAALSSGKYYVHRNFSTEDSEEGANNIISNSKLGASVANNLVYSWDLISDPNHVIVTLNDYQADYFWYKFFGQDQSEPFSLSARADIIEQDSDNPYCVCGTDPGVFIKDRTLCVVGTQGEEQVQIASDGNKWKVKSVFDDGDWEEEEWYRQNAVDRLFVIAFSGHDQIQLNDMDVQTIVDAGCGDDQIEGSTGPDLIYGNEGDDQIQGNEGNDIIYGGNGDDQLQGGNGSDTLYTDGKDSSVDGGSGSDTTENGIGYSIEDCSAEVTFECDDSEVILVY